MSNKTIEERNWAILRAKVAERKAQEEASMAEIPEPPASDPVTEQDIEDILAIVDGMPSKLKGDRPANWIELAYIKLFYLVINAGSDESCLGHMADIGKKFRTKMDKRIDLIEAMIPEEWYTNCYIVSSYRIRQEIGPYNRYKYHDAIMRMWLLTKPQAEWGEINCMRLGIRPNTALDIATYLYRPFFYIDLFLGLFRKA